MICDDDWIRRATLELLSISSLSGAEGEAQAAVERLMLEAGADVRRVQVDPDLLQERYAFRSPTASEEMFSVVGRWSASESPFVVLNGHIDTVAPVPSWSRDPLEPAELDGWVVGLGAADMKASLVSAIAAASRAAESGTLVGCVEVQSVPDEEAGGGTGTLACVDELLTAGRHPDLVVVCEPTELDVAVAQVGSRSLRVTVKGLEAHSNTKHMGASAVEHAMDLAHRLLELPVRFEMEPHELLPSPSVNIGRMVGGVGATTVADHCEFEVCVTYSPMSADSLVAQMDRVVAEWKLDRDQRISLDVVELHNVRPFESRTDGVGIQHLANAAEEQTTRKVALVGFPAGSDGRLFAEHLDADTVIFGPGSITRIHKADEAIELAEVFRHADVLKGLLSRSW